MPEDLTPDQVMAHLTDVDYPADKAALLAAADRSGADDAVLRAIRAVPPVDYRSRDEVVRSLRLDPAPGRPAGHGAEQARYDSKPGIAEHERDPQENRVTGADRRSV